MVTPPLVGSARSWHRRTGVEPAPHNLTSTRTAWTSTLLPIGGLHDGEFPRIRLPDVPGNKRRARFHGEGAGLTNAQCQPRPALVEIPREVPGEESDGV